MITEHFLQQWIVDALGAASGRGSDLDVARHVWQGHEAEIRAAESLLFTWQVDLRTASETLADAGRLRRADDLWILTDPDPGAITLRPASGWEPEELTVMATAYVAMLRDEHEGRRVGKADVVADVVARTGRDARALERIWSNIAHVVQELGYQPLGYWPPRSNVPVGVRAAVRQALGD